MKPEASSREDLVRLDRQMDAGRPQGAHSLPCTT